MRIRVNDAGHVFTNRFQGEYSVSINTVQADLNGGCYNDSKPSPVTSVTLEASPHAPLKLMDKILKMLASSGWPTNRIQRVSR